MKKGAVIFVRIILICIFNLSLFIANAAAGPFHVPEKFVYDLTWTGVKAGTASLELTSEGSKTKITSRAQSADWVSVFYTVDDRVESVFLWNPSLSSQMKQLSYKLKTREGKHRKHKEVIFDPYKNKGVYIDYLSNKKKEYDLPSPVFDPLSSFYYVRSLNLVVGKSVFVTIFDSKKVWDVEVQVLRKEKISIPEGTFETIVVKPLMKSEGIFSRKGDILIWLTDDAKHIPVQMQTKVVVGSITATLVQGYY
jgi:Protein of unknown function (DUF3108)